MPITRTSSKRAIETKTNGIIFQENKLSKTKQSKSICTLQKNENSQKVLDISQKTKPSCSIVQSYLNFGQTGINELVVKKARRNIVLRELSELTIYNIMTPFKRRVTTVTWHPTIPTLLAVGSKFGEILIWKNGLSELKLGQSFNESILDIHFSKLCGYNMYIVDGAGNMCLLNIETNQEVVLLHLQDIKSLKMNLIFMLFGEQRCFYFLIFSVTVFLVPNAIDKWYTSFDLIDVGDMVLVGDTMGNLTNKTINTMNYETIWCHKLHKKKITSVHHNPREPWQFATSSIDQTVKLWDLRKMANNHSPLVTLTHTCGVNSSYFSSTDGARLVTTDQSNELRVYRAPLWDLETTIIHTHRRFQYLTPIKAAWHPLEDIIVVGRYADANIPQFSKPHIIDMFDAASGNLVYEMSNPEHKGIAVLNKFNSTGDMMASGIGYSIAIMKPSPMLNSNSHFSQNKKRLKRTSDKSIPCAPRPKNAK